MVDKYEDLTENNALEITENSKHSIKAVSFNCATVIEY